jgi:hypothetical protein
MGGPALENHKKTRSFEVRSACITMWADFLFPVERPTKNRRSHFSPITYMYYRVFTKRIAKKLCLPANIHRKKRRVWKIIFTLRLFYGKIKKTSEGDLWNIRRE